MTMLWLTARSVRRERPAVNHNPDTANPLMHRSDRVENKKMDQKDRRNGISKPVLLFLEEYPP